LRRDRLEKRRSVQLTRRRGASESPYTTLTRYIDIVLDKGQSAEEWIEVKSLKDSGLSGFAVWKMAQTGRTSNHRQFFFDVAAAFGNEGILEVNGETIEVDDASWLFQRFRVRIKNGPEVQGYSDKYIRQTIAPRLRARPTGKDSSSVIAGTFTGGYEIHASRVHVDGVNFAEAFLDQLGDAIYELFAAELVQELVDELAKP
jgi:hypothetical protein